MNGQNKKSDNKLKWLFPFFSGLFALFFVIVLSLNLKIATPFCANSISCIDNLSGKTSAHETALFMGKEIKTPSNTLATQNTLPVLGINNSPNKHIYVDLTNQKLYAFDGSNLLFTFPISSGKWYPTPTGTFRIWIKLASTRMTGGSKALGTYYDLPNVPWTMFFYNDEVPKSQGFALHGAYWQNNFGHPMSYGCVNISVDNAKLLYDFADPQTTGVATYETQENEGTQVTIFGVTPNK